MSLTTREIAERLPEKYWKEVSSGAVYPNFQRRITVTVSINTSIEALRYIDEEDYSSRIKFAKELIKIISPYMSANDSMALMSALFDDLTAWQTRRNFPDDPVRAYLEHLLRTYIAPLDCATK